MTMTAENGRSPWSGAELPTSKALAACLAKAEEQSVFKKLLSKVKDALPQNAHTQDSDTWDAQPLDARTLVSFLKLFQDTNPKLRAAFQEREQGSGEAPQQAESTAEEETLTARLLCFREELIQSVTQLSPILEFLEAIEEGFLTASGKRVVLDCCEGNSQKEAVDNLLRKVDEEKTLKAESFVKLLGAVKASFPELQLLLDHFLATANISDVKVATSESTAIEIILRHGKLISEAIQQREDLEGLAPGQAGLREAVREPLSISAQKGSSEASLKAALSTAQEKSVPAIQICQLLCSVHESFPALQPVMQELGHVGLLTEGSGEKAGIRKWKVNNESQTEALGKDEDKAGGGGAKEAKESQDKASPKKSFVCKACEKAFHFYCRLKVHMEHCRVARGKQIQCKECSEVKRTKKELEKHQLEVHGMVGMAKKKKKRLPVACDICGREFAHASGMQYHKLTEHFDEKPFSCQGCGAKFVASSTLKNHLRLHRGDRPCVCKHCLMTFMQASAPAYHTKKKHTEGKMCSCQRCHAAFAQSMELSRHVRTHSKDKPCACRDCGRGFRQSSGLCVHLRPSHNPYDCKKCQMSFATLQEHRKHVHKAHAREYHPCPTRSEIFSVPSLLEHHMVTHVGGKPFTCEMCDKAYQQLSGLWYHNQSHHPDVFAAQYHCSSRSSSLQCSSCAKTFTSTASRWKHVKAEHLGSQLLCCFYCSMSFRSLRALQSPITSQHLTETESTFTCELCGELLASWGELQGHFSKEHPKVALPQATTAQAVQVIQMPEQGAAEHITSFDDALLVTLPESQVSQTGSELVTVTMEDLFDDSHSDL